MIKRFIVFVVGMNVLAIGIILNTKSLLGVGSINTLPYALANILSVDPITVRRYLKNGIDKLSTLELIAYNLDIDVVNDLLKK